MLKGIFGYIIKLDSVLLLTISLSLSMIAFCKPVFLRDPFSWGAIGLIVLFVIVSSFIMGMWNWIIVNIIYWKDGKSKNNFFCICCWFSSTEFHLCVVFLFLVKMTYIYGYVNIILMGRSWGS